MNKNDLLDKCITTALACDEEKLPLKEDSLNTVKQRLEMEESMLWRVDMKSLFKKRTIKFSLVFALMFVLIGSVLGVGASALLRTDNIDYPFADDPRVMGKWQSVDIVKAAEEFKPGGQSGTAGLFLKEFAFIPGGKMLISFNEGNGALAYSSLNWTKGVILNSNEKTASKYEIMDMDGSTYMFYEWKSGDYILRGMQPLLYVLKKVDDKDYTDYKVGRTVDNVDYPFADDPQVIGKWSSVDFVRTIDEFNPEKKNWNFDLFLTELVFHKDGKLAGNTTSGNFASCITWTKGLVLNPIDFTASAYTIKKISGSTYLFFEWKSGDYTFRGMTPQYYVLKKE